MSALVRNTTAVTAAFIASTALSFVQVKLLTRWLPQAELGQYFAVVALGALISVLAQVGLPMVVLRFTAKYDALDDRPRILRLVRFAWIFVLALSGVVLALERWFMPGLLPRFYEVPPPLPHVLLATGVFIAMALRQVTYACFDGLRRMSFPAVLENVNLAVITLCIVVWRDALSATFLLSASLVSGLAMFVLASSVLLVTLRRSERARDDGAEPTRAPLLPDILPFWAGAGLNGLVGISFGYADKLLVSLFLSYELVSIFYVAERLTFLMRKLLAVPIVVSSPEMTRRWELGRREELRVDLGLMIKVQLAAGLLIAAVVQAIAEIAVLIVSTPAFLAAADLLRVLALSVVLMAIYAPITTFMRAIERIDLALISDVMWIVFYLGGGVALVPRFGLHGIVAAQVIASAVTALYNLVVGQRVGRIAWQVSGVLRVMALGVLVGGVGHLLSDRLSAAGWPAAAAAGLGMIVLYHLLLVWTGALSRDDRRRFQTLTGGARAARWIDRALFWPILLNRGNG